MPLSAEAADRAGRVAAEIAALGPVLPGTILARSMRCRSPGCHCHADPPHLHGPYWFWTRKVEAKTVSQVLRPEQADEYRSWSETDRRLRTITATSSYDTGHQKRDEFALRHSGAQGAAEGGVHLDELPDGRLCPAYPPASGVAETSPEAVPAPVLLSALTVK